MKRRWWIGCGGLSYLASHLLQLHLAPYIIISHPVSCIPHPIYCVTPHVTDRIRMTSHERPGDPRNHKTIMLSNLSSQCWSSLRTLARWQARDTRGSATLWSGSCACDNEVGGGARSIGHPGSSRANLLRHSARPCGSEALIVLVLVFVLALALALVLVLSLSLAHPE
jgi:hypothetical protein